MYTFYKVMAIVLFSLSGALLLTTVILGVKFKIFKVIGDVSGINAKKSIEKIKDESKRKTKSEPPSRISKKETETTEKIQGNTDEIDKTDDMDDTSFNNMKETTLLGENAGNTEETALLGENGFGSAENNMETSLLNTQDTYTQELSENEIENNNINRADFIIEENIVILHTDEVI